MRPYQENLLIVIVMLTVGIARLVFWLAMWVIRLIIIGLLIGAIALFFIR